MLRQSEALQIGNELIRQHLPSDWLLQFNKSTKALGQCWHQSKVIAISTHLLNSTEEAQFRDTMLHEIAHAICGPFEAHGPKWIETAKSLGCTAEVTGNFFIDTGRSVQPSEQKPVKKIGALKKACSVCGKPAIEKSRAEFSGKKFVLLECGHLRKEDEIKESDYEGWVSANGYKLFPYQVDGARFIEQSNGRCLIADEPGLGKTVQALSFLKFHPEISLPALWICKSTLKIQATKEILEWCGVDYFPNVIDSSGSYIFKGMKIYVISMDLLRRMNTEKIDELGIKTVIFDEVQHIKNPDSTRTNEVRRIVNKVDFFIALSGTPWKNKGSEYFPVLNMLAPERFRSYNQFQSRWVDWYTDQNGKTKQGGIRDIPRFREYTKDIVIRRMREDVLPDLPKINRQIRYVELESIYGEAYEKAEKKVAEIIKDLILDGAEQQGRMRLSQELMKLKHITGLAKVQAQVEDAIEFLEDTEDWQKLTIFHHHIDVGDDLEKKLNHWLLENGYRKSLRLEGGVGPEKRNEIVEEFKANERARVLIASTLASGEGLNLQFCQNASMMERQWNPANEEQAELRFSRPLNIADLPTYLHHIVGQHVSIRIPYLICAGTIDEMLTGIIERKRHNYRISMNVKDEGLIWSENETMSELRDLIIKKRYGGK